MPTGDADRFHVRSPSFPCPATYCSKRLPASDKAATVSDTVFEEGGSFDDS